jgi:hypothetical protein
VSLFFLISCGIPTYVSLNNGDIGDDISYYSFNSTPPIDDYITTNLEFHFIDSSFVVDDSPSVCYFYSIFPDDGQSETIYSSDIINKFENTYSTPLGRPLDTSQSDESVINIDKNDYNIKLYKFSYNDLDQKPTTYLATINALPYDYVTYVSDFKISKIGLANNISFILNEETDNFKSKDSSNNFIVSKNLQLKRYNNQLFINSSINANNDFEYLYLPNDEIIININYKVLVFAALSVEGDFSNIFWSELHKVGSFDI